MPIPDMYEIGLSWVVAKNSKCSHFWDEVPDISNENRDAVENDVFRVYVWLFWALIGLPMVRDGTYTNHR